MNHGTLLDRWSRHRVPVGARPPRPHALQWGLRLAWAVSVLLGAAPPALVWLARGKHLAWGTLPHAALRVSEHVLASGATAPLLPIYHLCSFFYRGTFLFLNSPQNL